VDGRFVTFKRRLVAAPEAEIDGIEWTLWREEDHLPVAIAAFREPLDPTPQNVNRALVLIRGWLVDGWASSEAQAAVQKHPRVQAVDEVLLISGKPAAR
jgi:hypothetical protein